KAAAALGWAVAEMNDRYNKFADRGVRDLQSYNEAVRADGEEDLLMPQIVIIIDELADLIMAAQNQVEDYISRLAAKARAAGMHLIVATQRPSVDVITGVIKANIPSRIAFAVSSQVDSRTILDMAGAEKLLGKGDMLYSPQGISKPVRVQGSFVSDQEVFDVIDFIKQNCEKVTYSESVTTAMNKAGAGPAAQSDEDDELLADAIDTVVRSETASVSSLQRRFRIGYNRAARLIDLMEERGIVGPADGSKPRKVLLSIEQYEDLVASSQGGEPVPDEIDAYTEDR
ncbi:MAG: DNA translocase FtsK, partial [Firmicutes bacterium]|nr:DNA translocase FtsK [Bacillota bacterium]